MMQGTNALPPAASAATLAAPAPLPASEEHEQRLRHYQLENLNRQAGRVPVPMILAAVVVAYIAWKPVPGELAIAWVVALGCAVVWRGLYARRPVDPSPSAVEKRLRTMVLLSAVNGSVAGLGAAYFFAQLPTDRQTLLTMIVVGWTAGAVSANAAYARAFYAYTLALLTPIAVAWALQGPQGLGIAALAMLFLLIETSFVRDNEKVFRQSFAIRYENELLVRKLEQQSDEILQAKESAEAANLAKSRFLAAASHDIRQPLHTIGLYSAALSLRKADERSQTLARQISQAVTSLGSLLDSLLDISKLDAAAVRPELTVFDAAALLNRLSEDLQPVAQARQLTLDAQIERDLYVHTDARLLERIVRNLMDNAIKYTRQGGLTLHGRRVHDQVFIDVQDTGVGIPPEERERIYEEFYQLANAERDRAQGLGLGLAIVQRLVHLLDIRLTLDSEVGRGSRFTLNLPRARPLAAAAHDDHTLAPATDLTGLRVLVVEDETAIREGMRILLEGWGMQALLAADQDEALRATSAAGVDLVIADFRLRAGHTGLEVIRALRSRYPAVPALVVSGDTAPERLREIQQEQILLLHKPVTDAALRQAIETTLRLDSVGPAR